MGTRGMGMTIWENTVVSAIISADNSMARTWLRRRDLEVPKAS
jgi:hypothetical protein